VRLSGLLTRGRVLAAAAAIVVAALAGGAFLSGTPASDAGTVVVTRGEHLDIVEIRGQVQPVRSTYVTAPFNAGELQILRIAANGTAVKAGDVVAEFDAVTLRRTIQEKQSELRTAQAELEQAAAQARIAVEEKNAAVRRAEFDVVKARLSLGEIGLVSEIQAERSKLALADADERLREGQAALAAARANAKADRDTRERRIEKVTKELAVAEAQVAALHVRAPTDGTVSLLPNYQSSTPMSAPQEYRAGDRAFPGATILELPDLSSVFLLARIDEADRGRLSLNQTAVIRVDAIADRDFHATVSDISLLARIDFQSGWPPPKQFDLEMTLRDPDDRLRPGMSAVARITVGRLANALLVPAASVFYDEGRTVVYRATRRGFEAVPVEIVRRSREQAAVSGAISEGDRISRTRPGDPASGGSK
jgi:multidrug resistance efflux pump